MANIIESGKFETGTTEGWVIVGHENVNVDNFVFNNWISFSPPNALWIGRDPHWGDIVWKRYLPSNVISFSMAYVRAASSDYTKQSIITIGLYTGDTLIQNVSVYLYEDTQTVWYHVPFSSYQDTSTYTNLNVRISATSDTPSSTSVLLDDWQISYEMTDSKFVKKDGVWKPIINVSVKDGSTFKPVSQTYIKQSGTWKAV